MCESGCLCNVCLSAFVRVCVCVGVWWHKFVFAKVCVFVPKCVFLCVFVQKCLFVSACVCVCLRLFLALHENEYV